MTDTVQKNAPAIKAEIEKARSILLHCHPSADPDSVGSALAMKRACEQMGKKATIIRGDTEISDHFDFPGISEIVPKNFFEIDLKDFDLFLILDSGSPGMISTKGPVKGRVEFPSHLMTVVIDHHATNQSYGKLNCVDATYASTAEILFDLFKEMGIRLDHDIALNLFMGMYTDTGGFKYSSVKKSTFEAAAELVGHAPDFTKTIATMENSLTRDDLSFRGLAMSSIKTYLGDRVALVALSLDDLSKQGLKPENHSPSEISAFLRMVKGFDVAGCIMEDAPGLFKASFRSKNGDITDVSKLAALLGGGGHKAAAGVRLAAPSVDEAVEKVVKTAQELYNL